MILGLTPARGGSKGIPHKNIKPIHGKPLIAWTIESALKAELLDQYYVSTEDTEISEISKYYGAKVIDRPNELSTDETDTLPVLRHVLEVVPADVVVLLQATSPIRGNKLIDDCIREFLANDYDSLATGFICKFTEYGTENRRRQDIQGFFYDDGNVYVIKADLIRKGDRYGNKIGRKITRKWENLDIDDHFDFWLAEKIMTELNSNEVSYEILQQFMGDNNCV